MAIHNSNRSRFFLHLSLAFLGIATVGFSTTFFFPLARGTFQAPPVVHVHGAMLFGWLLLFIVQTALVQSRRVLVHRRLGWIGALLAVGIVASGALVGQFATHRDLAASGETWPYGAYVNVLIEMLVFGVLVGAGVVARRRPEAHKRFLVLATISALGPAWFRFRHFMPFVPNPLVSFSLVADSVWLFVMARDRLVRKRIHPVYFWAGGAMFAVHAVEMAAGESRFWLHLGQLLLPDAPP